MVDLIYRSDTGVDIGVLKNYKLDMAYGSDENDFEISIPIEAHCIQEHFFIYIEGTEIGGIVDTIKADVENKIVTYSGRTWHGILANILTTKEYAMEGNAADVLNLLLADCSLSELFEFEDLEYEVNYVLKKHSNLYDGLTQILKDVGLKLLMKFDSKVGKVILSANYIADYSVNDEFDSTQVDFVVSNNYNPTNHLICYAEDVDRTIHLFTDENGGLLNVYSDKCDKDPFGNYYPKEDIDYITDTSNQKIFGLREVAELLDCTDSPTYNYVHTASSKLTDIWDVKYADYYYIDYDEETEEDAEPRFKQYEATEKEGYVKIDSVEAQLLAGDYSIWLNNCENYYYYNGTKYIQYKKIYNGGKEFAYVIVPGTKKPKNWDKEYSMYYISDGAGGYTQVGKDSKEYYKVQTERPSNWNSNKGYTNYYFKQTYIKLTKEPSDWNKKYKNYYTKNSAGICVKVTGSKAPKFVKHKYYSYNKAGFTKISEQKSTPKWQAKKYYTKYSKQVIPKWHADYTYYNKFENLYTAPEVPSFSDVYKKGQVIVPPKLQKGNVYYRYIDNYAKMVEAGTEHLREVWENAQAISADLDSESNFDIGDIVGAREDVTGIFVVQKITKKIITIENNILTISYEIGGYING